MHFVRPVARAPCTPLSPRLFKDVYCFSYALEFQQFPTFFEERIYIMLGAFSLQEEDETESLLGENVVIAASNLLSLGPSKDIFITWEPDKFT